MHSVSQRLHYYPPFLAQIQRHEESASRNPMSCRDLPILYQTAGEYYQSAGNYQQAHEYYLKATHMLLDQNNFTATVASVDHLVKTCLFLKRSSYALDALQYRVAPLVEKMRGYASSQYLSCPRQELFRAVAVLSIAVENYPQAATYFGLSAEVNIEQEKCELAAAQLTQAAHCYTVFQQYAVAAECHERASEVHESLENYLPSAESLQNAGDNYVLILDREKAATCFEEAAMRYHAFNSYRNASDCFTKAAINYRVSYGRSHDSVAKCFWQAANELMRCGPAYAEESMKLLRNAAIAYRASGSLANAAVCEQITDSYFAFVHRS